MSTETSKIREIISIAEEYGCLAFHDWNPRLDTPGFPDLVIVGPYGTIFRELKADKWSAITKAQKRWLHLFHASGLDAGFWYYKDVEDGRVRSEIAALTVEPDDFHDTADMRWSRALGSLPGHPLISPTGTRLPVGVKNPAVDKLSL